MPRRKSFAQIRSEVGADVRESVRPGVYGHPRSRGRHYAQYPEHRVVPGRGTMHGLGFPETGTPGDAGDWAKIAARVIHMDKRMAAMDSVVNTMGSRMNTLESDLARMRRTWSLLSKGILGSLVGIIALAVTVLVQVGQYKERVDRLVEVSDRMDQRIEQLWYLDASRYQRGGK